MICVSKVEDKLNHGYRYIYIHAGRPADDGCPYSFWDSSDNGAYFCAIITTFWGSNKNMP